MRGRYPAGLEYVDKLDGAAEDKERLKAILATMNGAVRWLQACDQLDVSESRLHQLRDRALQSALDGIRPRPAGRPSRQALAEAEQIRALQQRVQELELAVQEAQVREEVALILPQRGEVEPAKKGAVAECQVAQAEATLSPKVDGADLPPISSKSETVMPLVDHMNIMQAHAMQQRVGGPQPERRVLERQVRLRALELADRLTDVGIGLEEAAARLGISARTLRHWDLMLRQRDDGIASLGRPRADSGVAQQQAVLDQLQSLGPGVGVPTLRSQFADMARAELDRLVKGYRDQWREKNRRPLHVLRWLRPGTVWAMDFAEAPSLIDGIYPYLLAVRDLASGKQLLWRPVMTESAEVVMAELAPLFMAYGAPWVLKSDNGPAFRADPTKRFLTRWEVFALFSPPHMPSYNGAIEAAIGSLKSRTHQLALLDGQPDLWTSGLVEAARRQANATARPRRLHGLTPDEVWEARQRLTADERAAFRASVRRYQFEEWQKQEPLPEDQIDHWTKAAVDRVALRRACVTHDLLLFRRRSIPGQIKRPKAANKG